MANRLLIDTAGRGDREEGVSDAPAMSASITSAAAEGRRAEARAPLAPVYSEFTEGFDTADLQEANVLLDKWS
jgi:predicted ATPase